MGVVRLRGVVAGALALGALLVPVQAAQAAFPGQNGKIAFTDRWQRNAEVGVVNPDGSGRTLLTDSSAWDGRPQWSPDGTKIAFVTQRNGNDDVYVMEADGSNEVPLTLDPGDDWDPHWSADGTKIAFTSARDGNREIYVMDADGANEVRVTDSPLDDDRATWSPDGTQLAFTRAGVFPDNYDVYRVNADGSGLTLLTGGASDPDNEHNFAGGAFTTDGSAWSPDGAKIAFRSYSGFQSIWIMNPDGSDKQELAPVGDDFRGWSPVGRRILFSGPGSDTYTINPDGTDLQRLTNDPDTQSEEAWSPDAGYVVGMTTLCDEFSCTPVKLFVMKSDGSDVVDLGFGRWPDWQPIPVNAYPRPKAASPQHISLVPAFQQCTSANRTHGPPLAFPSCAPPVREPGQLTVGTPDANGKPAKNVGELWISVMLGDPATPADEADVHIYGQVGDVRLASDLSDYMGSLEARVNLRITDKNNTPHPGGPGAGTVEDLTYTFPIPCSPTADTTVGSACPFDTTAEALLPGVAKERSRAIWELGQLSVHDASGGIFLRQGIFVP